MKQSKVKLVLEEISVLDISTIPILECGQRNAALQNLKSPTQISIFKNEGRSQMDGILDNNL